MAVSETFLEWLRAELNKRNLSQTEASKRAGLNPNAISDIVNGQTPGLRVCKGLARVFDTTAEDVLRRAGHLSPKPPAVSREEEVLELFRSLNPHDRQAAIKVLRGLAEYPSPEPMEMRMMREIPQLDALRKAIDLWGQGKEIEAFWPLAAVLSPEMQEKVEQFLLEIKEGESREKQIEGGIRSVH